MDRIEEVTKILEEYGVFRKAYLPEKEGTQARSNLAYVICQLFPEPKAGIAGVVLCPCVKGLPCPLHPKAIESELSIGEPVFYQPNVTGTSYRRVEPDKSRLLTHETIRNIRKKQSFLDPYPSADRENAMIKAGAEAQRDLTTSILEAQCQEKVERIFRKIEDAFGGWQPPQGAGRG